MSIYRRDAVAPEWEPAPWTMAAAAADEQERGFHRRATRSISWERVPWAAFPPEGIFGHDSDWFSSFEVHFVASSDGEDLLLIQNIWHGWPDPPEWGLASRPSGRTDVRWQRWGHFPVLPSAWIVPE
jgi:hypothetical protein